MFDNYACPRAEIRKSEVTVETVDITLSQSSK